jgi:hypothetical protein
MSDATDGIYRDRIYTRKQLVESFGLTAEYLGQLEHLYGLLPLGGHKGLIAGDNLWDSLVRAAADTRTDPVSKHLSREELRSLCPTRRRRSALHVA